MTKILSKAAKRLIRRNDKLAKQNDKSVRLSGNIEIDEKYIRIDVAPELVKSPRASSPYNYKECYFSWCHSYSDQEGNWTWKNQEPRTWSAGEESNTIVPHMNNLIRKPWAEVEKEDYNGKKGFRKRLNKYQPLDSICVEAQIRWLELPELSQFEEMFRLRLGSDKRIWGIRVNHHFFMVWYERYHQICPVKN